MEGKLLFTQPNDNNWRKGRTIKLTPINALLVTNGKVIMIERVNMIGKNWQFTFRAVVKVTDVHTYVFWF
jgi:hypothetical protein